MYVPPPSYNGYTSNQLETGNIPQYGFRGITNTGNISTVDVEGTKGIQEIGDSKFKNRMEDSVLARCTNCQKENFSRVESKVASNGMVWAILCCCFGSPLLSLLVLCMEGFREFSHYCPSCNSIIAIYKPKFSSVKICLLVLGTLMLLAL
jgi:hypothetical protein